MFIDVDATFINTAAIAKIDYGYLETKAEISVWFIGHKDPTKYTDDHAEKIVAAVKKIRSRNQSE